MGLYIQHAAHVARVEMEAEAEVCAEEPSSSGDLLRALAPFPEARAAVLAELRRLST